MSVVFEDEKGQVIATLTNNDYILINTFENKGKVLKIINKNGELIVEQQTDTEQNNAYDKESSM